MMTQYSDSAQSIRLNSFAFYRVINKMFSQNERRRNKSTQRRAVHLSLHTIANAIRKLKKTTLVVAKHRYRNRKRCPTKWKDYVIICVVQKWKFISYNVLQKKLKYRKIHWVVNHPSSLTQRCWVQRQHTSLPPVIGRYLLINFKDT